QKPILAQGLRPEHGVAAIRTHPLVHGRFERALGGVVVRRRQGRWLHRASGTASTGSVAVAPRGSAARAGRSRGAAHGRARPAGTGTTNAPGATGQAAASDAAHA